MEQIKTINNKIDIRSLNLEELTQQILLLGEKKFRAGQIYSWLHEKKVSSFTEMTNLSAQFRELLEEKFWLKQLFVVKKLESSLDNTVKYLYELSDGNRLETVLMEYEHGNSICISTQVGCKMGCKFCASAVAGFVRNLLPSEMLAQIYESEKNSGKKVSSVVLMGIGEPLDNFDNVVKFLQILSSEKGMNMSLRHVSLSTCGIVPRIDELAKLGFPLTLSVSLHAVTNEKRSEIMPINNKYDINALINSCKNYLKSTKRRISFEYALIDGLNDSKDQAFALAKLLKGMLCHVNIIPVNKISERNFSSSRSSAQKFQKYLEEFHINATIRRTLGSDIEAACGQLRRENEGKT